MVIRDRRALQQFLSFDNLAYGKLHPSDIDLAFEFKGKAWVFVEVKRKGTKWPRGQSILYERLTTDLIAAGKKCLTIRASHTVPVRDDVDVSECEVHHYLDKTFQRNSGWQVPSEEEWPERLPTVKMMIDYYLWKWDIRL